MLKMKKILNSKKMLVMAIICLLVMGVIVIVLQSEYQASQEKWKYHKISPDWDRIKANFTERNDEREADNYLVLSENISLTEAELDRFIDFTEILGWGMTRATSAIDLIQMKALHYYANTIGLEPTDEEVRKVLGQYRNHVLAFSDADENAEDFFAFVEWTGLSVNEFWELYYDIAKLGAVHSKLEEYVRDTIFVKDERFDGWEEHHYPWHNINGTGLSLEEHDRFFDEWLEWLEEIYAQVLADEGIDLAEIEERLR
jgi:hypothetical protein